MTYSKVVQVRRNARGISPKSPEITPIELDLWLAEGIGAIETNGISGITTSSLYIA